MDSEKKKILFFTSGVVGGAERVSLTIAKMMAKEGYDVKIVHVCREVKGLDKFVPTDFESKHIKIHNIWDFTTIKLYRYIKQENPYAVFSSLHYLNIRVILAARLASIKHIIVRNNIGWERWNTLTKYLARLSYKKASYVILQTEDMRQEIMQKIPTLGNKLITIPNPLDIDTIENKIKDSSSPYNSDSINYVYVGRIHPLKGLDILLKAFSIVLKSDNNVFLTIVGDYNQMPDYYKTLKQLAEDLNLTEKINFIGFSENPYNYIKYADCFVLPSRMEGNPNVLHEAMYLETPVVATRCIPIIHKIVTPERGLTVDVDDIKTMSEAMIIGVKMKITAPYQYTGGNKEFINLFK